MKRYPGTFLLLASVLLGFVIEMAAGAVGNETRLLMLGAIPDSGIVGAQYWRLLTYAWLHAGYAHLAVNAVLLWWVGQIVERRTGSLSLVGLYFGGVLVGGTLILWRAALEPKPGVSVGASAAVFAVLTSALVLLHRRSTASFGQPIRARVALWIVLFCGLVISFVSGWGTALPSQDGERHI